MTPRVETFAYDDAIVRKFMMATIIWGVVGMLAGVLLALQLAWPELNGGLAVITFGRLRPLHTNAVIFAFAGNAVFAAIYYSTQRLLKARMFHDGLSAFHFWGWQAIIVAAAVTLPLGYTQGKEYAELEWPIDLAIAVVWVAFAVNFFGTIARRRERHIYVAIWFYIATVVTITVLHVFNNLALPADVLRSYPVYAGVQDAFMQWWYGHNAVGFLLTTPFLGLMYYYLPKAAGRPVYSYRLSILHFWSLVFIYIWAGPHHLHYTALPSWASTLGMVFSVMLWMPSWGGMLNGLLTLRGAWHRVAEDPILKFMVVAVTFYGMSTFEGPLMSVKSVNALSHYTDWTIAHVHGGALGWVAFITFGMIYWLAPRVFQTDLYSTTLATVHFWVGLVGILLYIVPIWTAGITQGLMWRAYDETGRLAYPDFVETVLRLMPMYWARALAGVLFLGGTCLCLFNVAMTWRRRPAQYAQMQATAAPLERDWTPEPEPASPLREEGHAVIDFAYKVERVVLLNWHRAWEGLPRKFTILVAVAVVVATLFEVIPTFLIKSNVPTIASVKPYTPLELGGRDIYLREGCYNCHSQMVRPFRAETDRYLGEYGKPGEFVYDRPFQWGSRRIGPDLLRVGKKYPDLWHVRHMDDPPAITKGSIMPPYPWMLDRPLDLGAIEKTTRTMAALGVPYTEAEVKGAGASAVKQARELAKSVKDADGPAGLEDKEIIALVAYLQRIGTDIKLPAGGDENKTQPDATDKTKNKEAAGRRGAGRRIEHAAAGAEGVGELTAAPGLAGGAE